MLPRQTTTHTHTPYGCYFEIRNPSSQDVVLLKGASAFDSLATNRNYYDAIHAEGHLIAYLGAPPTALTTEQLIQAHPQKSIIFISILEPWEMIKSNMATPTEIQLRGCKQRYLPWPEHAKVSDIKNKVGTENFLNLLSVIHEAFNKGEVLYFHSGIGKTRGAIIVALYLAIYHDRKNPYQDIEEKYKNAIRLLKDACPYLPLQEEIMKETGNGFGSDMSENPTPAIAKNAEKIGIGYEVIKAYKREYAALAHYIAINQGHAILPASSSIARPSYSLNTPDFHDQLVQNPSFMGLLAFMINHPKTARAEYIRLWFTEIHQQIKLDHSAAVPPWVEDFNLAMDTRPDKKGRPSSPTISSLTENESFQKNFELMATITCLHRSVCNYQQYGIMTTHSQPLVIHMLKMSYNNTQKIALENAIKMEAGTIKKFRHFIVTYLKEQKIIEDTQLMTTLIGKTMSDYDLLQNVCASWTYHINKFQKIHEKITRAHVMKLMQCGYPFGAILLEAQRDATQHGKNFNLEAIKSQYENFCQTLVSLNEDFLNVLQKQGFDIEQLPTFNQIIEEKKLPLVPLSHFTVKVSTRTEKPSAPAAANKPY